MTEPSPLRTRLVLAAILLVSLAANVLHLDWGLPDRWHPDEIVRGVVRMADEGSLEPARFVYPAGHFQLLMATVVGPAIFVDGLPAPDAREEWLGRLRFAARMVTALMGTGVVLLTWAIGRRMGGEVAGLGAAASLALAPGFAAHSHFVTVDVPSIFWMMLGVWLAVRAHDAPSGRRAVFAGLVFGLAAATKYPAGLGALLLVGSAFVHARGRAGDRARRLVLFGGLGVVLGFFVGNPYAFLQPVRFARQLVETAVLQSHYAGGQGTGFVPHVFNVLELSGPLVFLVFACGGIALVVRAVRRRDPFAAGILALLLVFYVMVGRMQFHPPRYVLPLLPLLALGAGLAIDAGLRWHGGRRFLPALLGLAAIAGGVLLFANVSAFARDDRIVARAWIEENVPREATIEVSRNYTVTVPAGWVNVRTFPYEFRRAAFRLARQHPVYRWLTPDAEAPPADPPPVIEPAAASLDALLARRPDFLILSERSFQRFLGGDRARTFPQQNATYRALLEGRTPYELVVDLRGRGRAWWEFEMPFVDAGVVILRWRGAPPEGRAVDPRASG